MSWCPNCKTEYQPHMTVCPDCGATLVSELPEEPEGREAVILVSAATANEANVIVATLEAVGIPAYTAPPGVYVPQYGNPVMGVTPEFLVWVPADAEAAARAVLESEPIGDSELLAAQQATDPEPDIDEPIEPEP